MSTVGPNQVDIPNNPIGVASFDHTKLAQLPEYQAAGKALDALVHAIRSAEIEGTQAEWLQAATDIAASLAYGDMCTQCRDSGPLAANGPIFPAMVELNSPEQLTARYECGECGHHWTTGWAVVLPDFG
jgi:hypothetical protein